MAAPVTTTAIVTAVPDPDAEHRLPTAILTAIIIAVVLLTVGSATILILTCHRRLSSKSSRQRRVDIFADPIPPNARFVTRHSLEAPATTNPEPPAIKRRASLLAINTVVRAADTVHRRDDVDEFGFIAPPSVVCHFGSGKRRRAESLPVGVSPEAKDVRISIDRVSGVATFEKVQNIVADVCVEEPEAELQMISTVEEEFH